MFNLEFIPYKTLQPLRPCLLLCGLDVEAEWARFLLKSKLKDDFNVREQDQFVPCTRRVKSERLVKDFAVSGEWIDDFAERFVMIIELFWLPEEELGRTQLVEDVVFASRYANEFGFEHLAVITHGNSTLPSKADVFKSIKNTVFLAKDSQDDMNTILSSIYSLTANRYKNVLVKKYKGSMQSNSRRFLTPWSCRSFYSFKSAVAFEAARDMSNALREYHSAYSIVIEEGNSIANKGEDKGAFCEFTRNHCDVILLRMVRCMFQLGSRKEAAAFLSGHLSWFSKGLEGRLALASWKIVINYHFGWLLESARDELASFDQLHHPGVYFSAAVSLFLDCSSLINDQVGDQTVRMLLDASLSSVKYFSTLGSGRRALLELYKQLRLHCSLQCDYQPSIELLDKSKCIQKWSVIYKAILTSASRALPCNPLLKVQLCVLHRDWSRLSTIDVGTIDEIEFNTKEMSVFAITTKFDRMKCCVGDDFAVIARIKGKIPASQLLVSRIMVAFNDSHSVLYDRPFNLGNEGEIEIRCMAKRQGELFVDRITIFVDDFASNAFLFKRGSFECDCPMVVSLPRAILKVESEPIAGFIKSSSLVTLSISNTASNSVRGTINILDVPYGMDAPQMISFEVGSRSTDHLRIALSSMVPIDGSIRFSIDYSCDNHLCEPMNDLKLPVKLRAPLEIHVVTVKRKLMATDSDEIANLFGWHIALSIMAKIDCSALLALDGSETCLKLSADAVTKCELYSRSIPRRITAKWTSANRSDYAEYPISSVPIYPIFAFHYPPRKEIVIVNESELDKTVVLDVERKGQVLAHGPKRLTCFLKGNSISRLPFTTYSLDESKGSIDIYIDGNKGTPEWLSIDD